MALFIPHLHVEHLVPVILTRIVVFDWISYTKVSSKLTDRPVPLLAADDIPS